MFGPCLELFLALLYQNHMLQIVSLYITLHYTFVQSMSYSHIIDYLGKQYAEFNEHKYA